VREPVYLNGAKVAVAASIGISLAPGDGTEPSELLKKADLALYRTKSKGRNDLSFFEVEMAVEAEANQRLENELREAILHNQLEVHYQPVVVAKTRRLCALEALVRWRHPIMGLMGPDQFIKLAEDTGLIVPIGDWVIQKACSDAVRWPRHIKVLVNVSPSQFRKRDLLEVILCTLEKTELSAERLELEITESTLLGIDEGYWITMEQIRRLGITVSLDDFGIGYSSLTYLTKFPFDKVKIDRSFTQRLGESHSSMAVVSSVVALANGLDIVTTAEGVETEDQFRLVRAGGVTKVQGYLFGRPRPVSELDFSIFQVDERSDKVA
jgi:predicted signal transduction protein with EAL and GGDEF domain